MGFLSWLFGPRFILCPIRSVGYSFVLLFKGSQDSLKAIPYFNVEAELEGQEHRRHDQDHVNFAGHRLNLRLISPRQKQTGISQPCWSSDFCVR